MKYAVGFALFAMSCGGDVKVDDGGPPPTFHRDVRPITEASCIRCHDDSGVGPFPLTTYEQVAERADLVADAVADRRMPPWLAGDGCNEYEGDWSLSQDEIDTIVTWAADGAPEGDPADAPPAPEPVQIGLSRVDHTLTLPEPYVPDAVEDDYRCFVLDWPSDAPVSTVTGYTVVPDDTRIVHHVIGYIVPPEWADEYDALDGADGKPGYSCFGGAGGPAPTYSTEEPDGVRWLGGWAPGGMGGEFPEGTGIVVQGGSRIVVQVHYHPLPEEPDRADQSSIQVMVDNGVPMSSWALIQPFADPAWIDTDNMEIPAGGTGVGHTMNLTMPSPFIIYTANLHMHTMGKTARIALKRQDGTEKCLLDIPRWDFEWQFPYRLTEPVYVEAGDQIELSCTWDNPSGSDVYWGDGTGDEMCLGTMYLTAP